MEEAKKKGRRLQAVVNPQFSANMNFGYQPQMYLKEINNSYFQDRKFERLDPTTKNPFDKIDNTYSDYEKFTSKKKNNETVNPLQQRVNTPTIFIDGVEIPSEVNWNKD